MPTVLIAAAFAASIVSCFAPEQNCALLAIGAIDAAEQEILVNAYVLTTGSGIPGALIRAHDRGVDVRLIADRLTSAEVAETYAAHWQAWQSGFRPFRRCGGMVPAMTT